MRELASSSQETSYERKLNNGPHDPSGGKVLCLPNLLNLIEKNKSSNTFFFSVELVPSLSPQLHSLLMDSLQAISHNPPLFAAVTWHAQYLEIVRHQTTGEITSVHHPAFEVVKILQNEIGIPAVMHFSVGMLSKAEVHATLVAARAIGVDNILALRGDLESTSEHRDFTYASDLVKYIRREFGDSFTVAVAGYPLGHPEAASYQEDLHRLKEKVDSGADIIFTQMILSLGELSSFLQECKKIKINVPIIPGLYVIQTADSLQRMAVLCKLQVPQNIKSNMEKFHGNEDEEIQYGLKETQNLLQWIHRSRCCPGVNFFTLNKIKPVQKLLHNDYFLRKKAEDKAIKI